MAGGLNASLRLTSMTPFLPRERVDIWVPRTSGSDTLVGLWPSHITRLSCSSSSSRRMAEPKKGWWEAQSHAPPTSAKPTTLLGMSPRNVTFMSCHFKAGTRVSWPRGAGRAGLEIKSTLWALLSKLASAEPLGSEEVP